MLSQDMPGYDMLVHVTTCENMLVYVRTGLAWICHVRSC